MEQAALTANKPQAGGALNPLEQATQTTDDSVNPFEKAAANDARQTENPMEKAARLQREEAERVAKLLAAETAKKKAAQAELQRQVAAASQNVKLHPAFENLGASHLHFRSDGIELALLPNSKEGEYLFKIQFNGHSTPSLDFRFLRAVNCTFGAWQKGGIFADTWDYYYYPRIIFTFDEQYAGFHVARASIDQEFTDNRDQRTGNVTTASNGFTIEIGTQSSEANQWLRQVLLALEAALAERDKTKPARQGSW